jgi:hypothetical protein
MTTLGKITSILFGINSATSVDVSLNNRIWAKCSHSVVDLIKFAISSRWGSDKQNLPHRKLMGSNIMRGTCIVDPYGVELSLHQNARPEIDAPSKFSPTTMSSDVIVNDWEAIQGIRMPERLTINIYGFLTRNQRLGKTSYTWRDTFRTLHSNWPSIPPTSKVRNVAQRSCLHRLVRFISWRYFDQISRLSQGMFRKRLRPSKKQADTAIECPKIEYPHLKSSSLKSDDSYCCY